MSPDHIGHVEPLDATEQVVGWASELDTCDAYIVVLGHPSESRRAFGPYDGRTALEAADHFADRLDVSTHIVRLHFPTPSGPGPTVL